jgi:hypothetical protein
LAPLDSNEKSSEYENAGSINSGVDAIVGILKNINSSYLL